MAKRLTKAELVARVAELEREVEALRLDGMAEVHLRRLEAAAAPFERRLKLLLAAEKRLALWDAYLVPDATMEPDVLAAYSAAVDEVELLRLSASETTALNGLYRQMAEVQGVLRSRQHGLDAGKAAPKSDAPLRKLHNVAKFPRGGRS